MTKMNFKNISARANLKGRGGFFFSLNFEEFFIGMNIPQKSFYILNPWAHMGPEHASREKKIPVVDFLIFVHKNV